MISKDDIEKVARNELKLFNNLKQVYPSLSVFEKEVFEQFKNHYQILVEKILKANNGNLYDYSLVIIGAIQRSLNDYRGALWSLATRNTHVFYNCLRSQCETLALLNYCVLNPNYVENATTGSRETKEGKPKIINIVTMIEKLDKKHNGICQDFDDLCDLVHPNPASLYANIKPVGETERSTLIIHSSTVGDNIGDETAELHIKLLIAWTGWIFEELLALLDKFN